MENASTIDEWNRYWIDYFAIEGSPNPSPPDGVIVPFWVPYSKSLGGEIVPFLIPCLKNIGCSNVLCVGTGISHEPAAFALAGMQVVGLDISTVAIDFVKHHCTIDNSRILYGKDIHYVPGGTLEFIVGDFRSRFCCPDPFDVIFSRRTIQYYHENLENTLHMLVDRLSPRGILVLHSHNALRLKYDYLEKLGFVIYQGSYAQFPQDLKHIQENYKNLSESQAKVIKIYRKKLAEFLSAPEGKRAAWIFNTTG